MQIRIKRSQREKPGVFNKTLLYCLDAKLYLTSEETAGLNHARLADEVIYQNDASEKHSARAAAEHASGNYGRAILANIAASFNLVITIRGLLAGQHIECKDMRELLAAEDALMQACENIKTYLDMAATFDGREGVVEFNGKDPGQLVVASAGASPIPSVIMTALPPPTVASQPAASPAFFAGYVDSATPSATLGSADPLIRLKAWWDDQSLQAKILIGAVAFILIASILFH